MRKTRVLAAVLAASGLVYGTSLLAHGATEASAKGKPMEYHKDAQRMQIKSMNIDGTNAYLEDIVSSNDPKAPISCGLFRIEQGNSLTYTYDYDEAKIILEGGMHVSDGHSKVHAKPGDILFFPKGSTITFTSDDYGLGFICGQRERDGA